MFFRQMSELANISGRKGVIAQFFIISYDSGTASKSWSEKSLYPGNEAIKWGSQLK